MRRKFWTTLTAILLTITMVATPVMAKLPEPNADGSDTQLQADLTSNLVSLPQNQSLSLRESNRTATDDPQMGLTRPRVHYRMPTRAMIEWRLRQAGRISAESSEKEIQQAVEEWGFNFAKVSPSWVHPEDKEAVLDNERSVLQGGSRSRLGAATPITASVLAIPVEFDATETLTFQRPNSTYTACITVTETFTGPLHGNIPYPGGTVTNTIDNNTAYYPSTEAGDYKKLIFGTEGITEPLRAGDPNVNDGNGVDISGLTVQTYYDAQSDNSVTVSGEVAPWVPVTHTEAYYGIDLCVPGFEPPATADGQLGRPADLVVEAAESLKAQGGDYATYDFWKQFDNDDDGVIDTLWIVHAGRGQEAGGGAEGEDSIWSHSTDLRYYTPYQDGYTIHDNGTPTTDDDLVIGPFTFQPEDGDLGVFTEEFGHNFFHFPDLYTTDSPNSVGWWSHMSAGSWGGELGGTRPVNMPLWFRMTANCSGDRENPVPCDWADPVQVLTYTTAMTEVVIGQAGEPAGGTVGDDTVYEGVRIDLPPQEEEVLNEAGEGKGAYSTSGDEMDKTLDHDVDLSGASAPVTLTFDAYWNIEENWDYGYVMLNDGDGWVLLDDLDGVLRENNPNGNNLGHGLTGSGSGTLRFDLSDYAGEIVTLRFRYRTDVAVSNPGWWIDNVAVSGGVLSEDFEGGIGDWTNDGWVEVPYMEQHEQYYLVEWRNDNGFDESLKYPYNTNYSDQDEWRVDRVPANVPAAVVMYRNTKYDFSYSLLPQTWDPPSVGSKYGLLVVDTNFWPVEPMTATFSGRLQSLDAGLALQDQPDFTLNTYSNPTKTLESTEAISGGEGVAAFHDALGYYPGFFQGGPSCPAPYVCWWDQDASVVVPSKGGKTYSTRITDPDKNPQADMYGSTVAGFPLGSGNPGDDNAQFGVNIELVDASADGNWGRIKIYNQSVDFVTTYTPTEVTETGTYTVTYQTLVENVGTEVAQDVALTYTLDADLNFVSITPGSGGTAWMPEPVWQTSDLAPGETVTVTVVATGTASTEDSVGTRLDAYDGAATRGPWFFDTTLDVGPDISVDPTAFDETLNPGVILTRFLTISNTGASELAWSVAEVSEVSWLSESPMTGTVAPDDVGYLGLFFDTNGLSGGVYTTTLQITSDDPDEGHVDVPVTLTVITGCIPVSGAGFTYTPASPSVGETVLFTGSVVEGSSPVTYTWDFGDSGAGMGGTIDHTYASSGIFSVTMMATNACSVDTAMDIVEVVGEEESQLYHTTFFKEYYGHNSTLYLQNPNPDSATVLLEFLTSSGDPYDMNAAIPAYGSLVVPADSVPGLPGGTLSSLVVSADRPVESVVRQDRQNTDKLGISRGVELSITEDGQPTDFRKYFGPFLKGDKKSSLIVWNISDSTATVQAKFINLDGTTEVTLDQTIEPDAQYEFISLNLGELPDGFVGWVIIASDQPVVGQVSYFDTSGELFQRYGALEPAPTQSMPRALKNVNESGGARTTSLFVGNAGVTATNPATLVYYAADGTVVYTSALSLPASGASIVNLDDESGLPSDDIWAVGVSGAQNLVLGEMTEYDSSSSHSVGTYGTVEGTEVSLPRIVRDDVNHTVFSVQNTDVNTATISIDYYSISGTLVLSQMEGLLPNGWVRYDQSQMTDLGDSFEGSVVIEASQPVKAWVDEYEGIGQPDITVDPLLMSAALNPGDIVTRVLTVANDGSADLTWRLAENPAVDWLDEAPTNGSEAPSDSTGVAVVFDATGLADGTYTTTLQITSDDPDEGQVDVPVTLTVTTACISPSGADFTYTPANPGVDETVTFTGSVAGGTAPFTYTWTFGDGWPGNGQIVDHSYGSGGFYTVTMRATNACGQDTSVRTLTVASAPGIDLTPAALNATLSPGGATTRTLTLESVGTADLSWNLTEDPGKGWLTTVPTSGILLPEDSASVAVMFDADGLDSGFYTTTLQVVSNDPDEPQVDVPVALTVLAPYFTLDVEPPAHGVTQGDSAAYTVTLTAYEGFTASVDLSVSSLPADASASFGEASLTPSDSTSLTVDTAATTPTGDYSLQVQAVGGDITRTQSVALVVQEPPSGQEPDVTNITPTSGDNTQTIGVTIGGDDFVATPLAYLGSTRLLNVLFEDETELKATVPANMNPGVYNLKIVNPNGQYDTLSKVFTVTQPITPDISYVMPTQGLNDTPVVLNIFGASFGDEITATLSNPTTTIPLLNLQRVSAGYLKGVVPSGSTEGTYDLIVANTTVSKTLRNAYTVIEAAASLDDLYASSQDLWVDPLTLRKEQTAQVGLIVNRQGGKQPLTTTVEFYLGSTGDKSIGEADTPYILGNGSENTGGVSWTPDASGLHTIYAVIDPTDEISETPAAFAESNNVVSKTFTVLSPAPDTSPPRVDDLTIADDAVRTRMVSVTLDATASEMDLPRQSGVSKVWYEEFEYSQGAGNWVLVQSSGWLDYDSSHVDYPWTLVDSTGVHYMRAWAADAAGNVSASPAADFINYIPRTEQVLQGSANVYRQYLEEGDHLLVRLTPMSGDPDLYVWPPDWRNGAWASINTGTTEDIVSFTADESGLYQIEVYGYIAAKYSIEITVDPDTTSAGMQIMDIGRTSGKTERTVPALEPEDTPSDQMAAPKAPSVAQSGVEVSDGTAEHADPNTVVTYTHTLTNTGERQETFAVEATAPAGWAVELIGGTYPTGTAELPLSVGRNMTSTFEVSLTVPAEALSGTYTTVITASSTVSETTYDVVTDTTFVNHIADVELEPNDREAAEPGDVVTYTHTLTNTGNYTDTFDLSISGWGKLMTISPITLGQGLAHTVLVSVSVPSDEISSTVDTTVITATSQADPSISAAVTDTTTVGHAPDVELEPGSTKTAEPGDVVTYTHTLTNTGNYTDTFDLSISGWGELMTSSPITLGQGLRHTVLVSITVPTDETSGTVDTTVITATSQSNYTVWDAATDITQVEGGRSYIYLPLVVRNSGQ